MKSLKLFFVLLVSVFIFSNKTQACSCMKYIEGIVPGVLERDENTSDPKYKHIVALVETLASQHHGVRAKVNEVLYGASLPAEILIWGDPGHLCRGRVNRNIGDKWIVTLQAIYSANTHESVGDYQVAGCITSDLQYFTDSAGNEMVKGKIVSSTVEEKELKDLKNIFQDPKKYLNLQPYCSVSTLYDGVASVGSKLATFNQPIVFLNDKASITLPYELQTPPGVTLQVKGTVKSEITNTTPNRVFPIMDFNFEIEQWVNSSSSTSMVNGRSAFFSRVLYQSYSANSSALIKLTCGTK